MRPGPPRTNKRYRSFGTAGRRILLASGALVLVALAAVAWYSASLREQLQALQQEPIDNLQWNVTQLELDAVRLESAARLAALQPDQDLAELRRNYDLFFSRAKTVINGETFVKLGLADTSAPLVAQMRTYLEETTPTIDGPDEGLRDALPQIVDSTNALRQDIRATAIDMIELSAAQDVSRRDELSAVINKTAVAALVLGLLLLVLLAKVLALNARSERRRRDLKRVTSQLEATVSSALDAVVVAGLDGRVLDFNPGAERIFGFTRAEAVGQSLSTLIVPPQHRAMHEAGMDRMRKTGVRHVVDAGRIQMSALRKSGEEFPVEMAIASNDGPDGMIFVAYMRDISDQKKAEGELVSARDEALAADRTKTNFIAVMSHEMRTPLNGVIGALDIMGRTTLDEKQGRFLNLARGAADQLLRHVNDVLDISRIDAGFVELADEFFDLPAQIATLAETLRPQAQKKEARLEVKVLSEFPVVRGDPFRLIQIVQNLVNNAIKFTEKGQIVVEVEVQRKQGNQIEAEIRVIDSGIGISEEDQERVFLDFVMVDPSYRRSSEGTGLGLPISRRLAHAMGGDIGVESTLGKGSCFWLRLPLDVANEPGTASEGQILPTVPRTRRTLDVLIVEDNETNRFVAQEMLGYLGHNVTLAMDGIEGVARAGDKRFDVILMDLSMPRMDGWTAAAAVRQEGASKNSRIIAITAHAQPDHKDRFRLSGIDMWLTKPLSIHALAAALDQTEAAITVQEDTAPQAMQVMPLLDTEMLGSLKSMSGDPSVRRVLASLKTQVDTIVTSVHSGISELPFTEIADLCHKGAGAAAVTGAVRLHKHLSAMEASCDISDRVALQRQSGDLMTIWQETWATLESTFLSARDSTPMTPR